MLHMDTIDKLVLFLCCMLIGLMQPFTELQVISVIVGSIAIGLISWFDSHQYRTIIAASFVVFCLFYAHLCFFIPVILYGCLEKKMSYWVCLGLLPLVLTDTLSNATRIIILTLALISVLFKLRAIRLEELRTQYQTLFDTAREISFRLNQQNQELLEKQDEDIRIATLNERNRIAREIHDNVGHQLSRSLLQVGALLTIHKEIPQLLSIKDTLSQSMDNIRNSVHNLYDTSIDLNAQIESLVKNFHFCDTELNMGFETVPEPNIKYALIAIVKEALVNVSKHSDATCVRLSFTEHPAFYQTIISDNGKITGSRHGNGIGLKNISQRAEALKGHFLVRTQSGFELFITIPKERKYERFNN